MINRVLSFSIQAHWSVVFLTVMVAAYGIYELTRLPLDALPDITNKQVMINYRDLRRAKSRSVGATIGRSKSYRACVKARRSQ
jgi:Cu/Ag efflux pump CusA